MSISVNLSYPKMRYKDTFTIKKFNKSFYLNNTLLKLFWKLHIRKASSHIALLHFSFFSSTLSLERSSSPAYTTKLVLFSAVPLDSILFPFLCLHTSGGPLPSLTSPAQPAPAWLNSTQLLTEQSAIVK